MIGAWLRLHMLSSQILLDDEWHSIAQVIGRNVWDVLTQFNPKDNSGLPFNLYNLFLYHTIGWSELTVRLPAILPGLLIPVVFPLLVKKCFNARVTTIFAFLLAISPFLIFYSRFSRAYSLMVLLCFSSLVLSQRWLTTGKKGYAIGYVLTGFFAVYVHLFSLIAVFIPLVVSLVLEIPGRPGLISSARSQIVVPVKSRLRLASLLCALLLPLLVLVLGSRGKLPWAQGLLTADSVIAAATLLSGTVNLPLNILFFSLCIAGQVFLIRQNPLLGWIFLCTIGSYILALLITHPLGIHTGVVLLRYMIVVTPIALTAVALGLDRLALKLENASERYRMATLTGIIVFLCSLFIAGPLPKIYTAPNNFTNHSAFQGSYRNPTWEYSDARHVYPAFSVTTDQIPKFYPWLATQSDVHTIIEYPFDICNYNNLFYYYQHFHQKRVLAGFTTNKSLTGYDTKTSMMGKGIPFSLGMLCVDKILSAVPDPAKLGFENMVDITDPLALPQSNAQIIVLHKYLMALKKMRNSTGTIPVYYRSVPHFTSRFYEILGPPLYEDEQIICFRIR